ncbi:non-ribosomal peptide synthetase [Streptantibioticus silvisoli]|uniref:Non-ribosomal peptide synthetase n=1 Tax=Streptantibioticus silvisoli TaxID=2705255 RepID=A0ABT6VW79_9ACTN|nr:non-ribosomal peptide synthetase [Streptantibioticus silvisoli]MDI5961997.1 non-ribosomal peptide synthetase [Streptantibioticus silvisoli]
MRDDEPAHDGDATHLAQVLDDRARRTPDAIALLAPGTEPLTFAGLAERVRAGADRLAACGVRRGDRVVVPAANDPDSAVTLLAVMSVAVCCPVNPGLAQDEYEAYFDVLEPTAILLADGAPGRLRRAALTSELDVVAHDGRLGAGTPAGQLLRCGRRSAPPVVGESVLLRTSGTTSAGKIVPLTMAGMLAAARASVTAYRLTASDRRLNLNPLFYVQGLVGGLVTALVSGSSMACVPAFDPAGTLRLLGELEPSWFSASPMTHRALLDASRGRPLVAPRLRFIRSGAAPMPAGLKRELESRFGVPLIESYGMSEASQIACAPLPQDGTAQGMLPSGSQVGVLGADGAVSTAAGASGEIVVRGGNVIERYVWPHDAGEAFVDGWLRTGDLGELAADGSLTITGRAKELINRGGEKVSPHEVEEVLLNHPAVGRAVVFGVPDGPTEHVAAVVVPRPGRAVDEAALRAYAVEHLAAFEVPERVVFRAELPLNASGKPVRGEMPRLLGVRFGVPAGVCASAVREEPGPARSTAARQTAAAEPAAPHDTLRPGGGRPEGPDPLTVVTSPAFTGPAGATGAAGDPDDGRGAAPRTPLEAALAGLWAYALGRASVGVDEDFFSLGGDPTSALSLLMAVEEALGTALSASDLFDGMRTVELMASAIERGDR